MSQNAMRRFASAVRLRLTSLSLASLLIFSLGTGAVLADGSSSKSPATAEPVAAERLATEPLTATGRVRLPNGSPAAHAVVTAFDTVEHSTSVETDWRDDFGCDICSATTSGSTRVPPMGVSRRGWRSPPVMRASCSNGHWNCGWHLPMNSKCG